MADTLKDKFNELYSKAKEYFGEEETQSFGEVTLADGTVISFEGDSLAEGVAVFVGEAPAPEGTHELEDGGSIVVDANGIVTEVIEAEAEAEAEEMSSEAPEAITKENVADMIAEAIAPLKEIFEGIQTAFESEENTNKELVEKLDALNEQFEKFKDEPTEAPKVSSKKFASSTPKNPRVQHLLNIKRNSN